MSRNSSLGDAACQALELTHLKLSSGRGRCLMWGLRLGMVDHGVDDEPAAGRGEEGRH